MNDDLVFLYTKGPDPVTTPTVHMFPFVQASDLNSTLCSLFFLSDARSNVYVCAKCVLSFEAERYDREYGETAPGRQELAQA